MELTQYSKYNCCKSSTIISLYHELLHMVIKLSCILLWEADYREMNGKKEILKVSQRNLKP